MTKIEFSNFKENFLKGWNRGENNQIYEQFGQRFKIAWMAI